MWDSIEEGNVVIKIISLTTVCFLETDNIMGFQNLQKFGVLKFIGFVVISEVICPMYVPASNSGKIISSVSRHVLIKLEKK